MANKIRGKDYNEVALMDMALERMQIERIYEEAQLYAHVESPNDWRKRPTYREMSEKEK